MIPTKKLQKQLKGTKPIQEAAVYLSTGASLLDLACSGRTKGGLLIGKSYLFVGGSNSGKTWLAHSLLAEASIDPRFDNFRFVYDNPEDGALMDIKRYFGDRLFERLEPPSTDRHGNPVYSRTVEDFYYRLDDLLNEKKPVIFVEDSMDCLLPKAFYAKFKQDKSKDRAGEDEGGSYFTEKARLNSRHMPAVLRKLRDTGSMLIIIAQTRDAIGSRYRTQTRSGGHALKYYATLELWTKKIEDITKTVKGKKRQIGMVSQVHVVRSRMTGRDRTVEIPILHASGIDNTGSMVHWLVEEKHWSEKDGTIKAEEFGVELKMEPLIRYIEENNLEKQLRLITGRVWQEIEVACQLKRKARYKRVMDE